MDISKLKEDLQSRFEPSIIKYGANKGTLRPNFIPFTINYRPITHYINGKLCYACLDMNNPRIQICYISSRRTSSSPVTFYGALETLETVLSDYDKGIHFDELSRFIKEPIYAEIMNGNSARYDCAIEGNMAVNILTQDFELLQKLSVSKVPSAPVILGVTLPLSVTFPNGVATSISDAAAKWYRSYMMQANIDLATMYWNLIPRNFNLPYIKRFSVLNEYVPFMMKFEGVDHPLLDHPSLMKEIGQRYPLFASLESAPCVRRAIDDKSVYDSQMDQSESYVMFILRGNLQQLFKFDMSPADNDRKESYSLNFFSSILLGIIQNSFPDKFQILEDNRDWFAFAKMENDMPRLADVTCRPTHGLQATSYSTLQSFRVKDAASNLSSWQRAVCYTYALYRGMDPFVNATEYDSVVSQVSRNVNAIALATLKDVI